MFQLSRHRRLPAYFTSGTLLAFAGPAHRLQWALTSDAAGKNNQLALLLEARAWSLPFEQL